MAIPQDTIDQIQGRIDIVEVISSHIPLKKIGRSYKALCPFHNEKTPSFIVSPQKQIYHCFGCGAGGNVFSFLMRYENLEFPEVIEELAKKAGVALAHFSGEKKEFASLANQLYEANEAASRFFETCLSNNRNAKEYLSSRGVGDEAIKKFRIGCAPDGWEGLLNFFKSKGADETFLEKSGLIIPNGRGGYYDRFRQRITFPIIDLKDRILGFGARVMDSSLPKYINSPETYVYSKGRNLYGLNFSKEHIKKEGHALIVEGYLDVIIPFQAGINNLIATLGTALTVDQVKALKRFTKTAVMVYDPDAAGEAASIRNLDLFISEDVNVYIAELPKEFDPDGYIRKFGADEFRSIIKKSKNLFDYKLDKLASRFNINAMYGKTKIASEMLPTIAKINNAVLKSGLLKKLAERLGVDEDSLKAELKKVKPDYAGHDYSMNSGLEPAKKDPHGAENMLLALLMEGEYYIAKVKEKLRLEEFKDTSVRDVAEAIFRLHDENHEVNPARLISRLGTNGAAAALVSEAVNISEILSDKERVLADCIARIKKDNIKDRLARLQDAIKKAYNSKEEEKVKAFVAEYNLLMKSDKI